MKVYGLIDELLSRPAGANVWVEVQVDGRSIKFPIDWVHSNQNNSMETIIKCESYD